MMYYYNKKIMHPDRLRTESNSEEVNVLTSIKPGGILLFSNIECILFG